MAAVAVVAGTAALSLKGRWQGLPAIRPRGLTVSFWKEQNMPTSKQVESWLLGGGGRLWTGPGRHGRPPLPAFCLSSPTRFWAFPRPLPASPPLHLGAHRSPC